MKKILLLLTAVFSASFSFISCDDDPLPSPQYFSFVSVNKGKEGEKANTFTTDDGKHLVPQNITQQLNIKDGKRAMVYFRLESENDVNLKDIPIYVNQIDTCFTFGTTTRVKTMDDALALGNNGMSLYLQPYYPQTTSKYFNFYVGVNARDITKHKFTLAYIEEAQEKKDTLTLMLCYDDANNLSPLDTWYWVSVPVDGFKDLYEGKEQIKVYIKTRASGMQEVIMPVPGKENQQNTKCID